MAGFSLVFEQAVLNTLRSVSITGSAAKVALFRTGGVQPTDTTPGTEPTTGGYAKQACGFGAPTGGDPSVVANAGLITYGPNSAATVWDVGFLGIYDAAGTTYLGWTTLLAPKNIAQNESAQFGIGALTVSLI